jgi:hypothetical protein
MGFFDNMAAKAAAQKDEKYQKKLAQAQTYLIEGEEILSLFQLLNDFACVTNKRLLFVDKTFMSKKTGVVSVPLSKVTEIALLLGGAFSFTTEVEIKVGTADHSLTFLNSEVAGDFYKAMVSVIC